VWSSRDGAEQSADKCSDRYMAGARRFDVGGKSRPTLLPGAIAGLEQVRDWSVEAISHTLAAINAGLAEPLQRLGFALRPEPLRCPHMFGARAPKELDTTTVVAELAKRKIYVAQRGDGIRVSPHLHVNEGDIARFGAAIEEIVGR